VRMIKSKVWIILILFTISVTARVTAVPLKQDPIYRALADEMKRSMKKLKMAKMETPFYIGYAARDYDKIRIDAEFGSIIQSEQTSYRSLSVDLRVGDYSFDSSNFIASGLHRRNRWSGSLVIDDDYRAMRRQIWLTTDRAYKQALERIARKRAYVKTRTIEKRPGDFSKEKPFIYEEAKIKLEVDREEWGRKLKKLSSVFKKYQAIKESGIVFHSGVVHRYYVNSEGFKSRTAALYISIEATASAQAEDGMELFDFRTFYADSLDNFPSEKEIISELNRMADLLTKLTKAQTLEYYAGPVLFADQASAEFMNQMFVENISNPRAPLCERERTARRYKPGKFAGKLNRRVLPLFMNVIDDPTIKRLDGTPLVGHYSVDDEGIPPQKISIVEKGKLLSLPMSRTPIKEIAGSNGHGRGVAYSNVVGNIGNLIVTCGKKKTFEELKSELIERCKDMELDYGILVKRMNSKSFAGKYGSSDSFYSSSEKEDQLQQPIEVYKVYVKNGHEELIRGAEFGAVTVRALRDIVASGGQDYVYNHLLREAFGRSGISVSIVVPSVLVEEMEFKKQSGEIPKLPVLKHPYFGL